MRTQHFSSDGGVDSIPIINLETTIKSLIKAKFLHWMKSNAKQAGLGGVPAGTEKRGWERVMPDLQGLNRSWEKNLSLEGGDQLNQVHLKG